MAPSRAAPFHHFPNMTIYSTSLASQGPSTVPRLYRDCCNNTARAPHSQLRTFPRRSQCLHAAAPQRNYQRSVKLPLDAAQAENYLAISRAFEARLSDLYKQAPDDKQLPTIKTETWDDEELLKEGRELGKAGNTPQGVRFTSILMLCSAVQQLPL